MIIDSENVPSTFKVDNEIPADKRSVQCANCVLMVPPKEFRFNSEAAEDNSFASDVKMSAEELHERVMGEYAGMVDGLRKLGVEVLDMDYEVTSDSLHTSTPDAVFPNNWFSTTTDGTLLTFPMKGTVRRREVRPELITSTLVKSGRNFKLDQSLIPYMDKGEYLESTGAMVIDHVGKTVYAALSDRCHIGVLDDYVGKIGYSRRCFETKLIMGSPVYHTNVIMSIGEGFCVLCSDAIVEKEREYVLKSLQTTMEVLEISIEKMNKFCGNILQLDSKDGKLIVMSLTAYNAFTPTDKEFLSRYGRLVYFDVGTIEQIGGGSVRCMMGEIFPIYMNEP